jgi:hypothetical protein
VLPTATLRLPRRRARPSSRLMVRSVNSVLARDDLSLFYTRYQMVMSHGCAAWCASTTARSSPTKTRRGQAVSPTRMAVLHTLLVRKADFSSLASAIACGVLKVVGVRLLHERVHRGDMRPRRRGISATTRRARSRSSRAATSRTVDLLPSIASSSRTRAGRSSERSRDTDSASRDFSPRVFFLRASLRRGFLRRPWIPVTATLAAVEPELDARALRVARSVREGRWLARGDSRHRDRQLARRGHRSEGRLLGDSPSAGGAAGFYQTVDAEDRRD